ncbi:MAG TPA: PA domain-containing protein [Usitatibacter sp.]|nr:PA domain-containing protein [Usitatibacter sp.]
MLKFLLSLATLGIASTSLAATVTLVNLNAPGVGLNDPTPAAPVGGNTGTTIGQQRLIALQHAANTWGAKLDSTAEIRLQVAFTTRTCTTTAAVLASSGTIQAVRDFPGTIFPNTWYHTALANKLAGFDLIPEDGSGLSDDIQAVFNINLGASNCLAGGGWYYGLDTHHSASQVNLVTVALHEFAHGLGFASFTNVSTGTLFGGLMDIYSKFYFDNTANKTREQMTNAERVASAINPRNVVWTGPAVTAQVPSVLGPGTPLLRLTAPASIAGDYQVGAAAFGPQLSSPGISGSVVLGLDDANAGGPSTTDACTAITNPAAVAGRIALVDRGTCGFVIKAKNLQNAGAIGVLIADNVAGGPPAGMAGVDPTITIPSVRITLADGNAIKAQLGGVNATLSVDLAVRAGADRHGRVLLNTPNPVVPGSSVSHWDPIAAPNQLMEPNINSDLQLEVDPPEDLTRAQLRDVGWYPDGDQDFVADDAGDQCLGSDLSVTVVVGGKDTGIGNTFFTNGCSIRDLVSKCKAGARNHGAYVSCTANLANTLVRLGFMTTDQVGLLQSAVARDKD